MRKPKSLQRTVLLSFVLSTFLSFSILGFYVSYDYKKSLEVRIQSALGVIAEDVIEHQLLQDNGDDIKMLLARHESYHETYYNNLFERINFSIVGALLLKEQRCTVYKAIDDQRYLRVTTSCKKIDTLLFDYIQKLVLVFMSVVLVVIGIFSIFLNKLFEPLRCLVGFCKESSSEHASIPLCTGSSEVEELRRAIIALLETNHNLCQQKQDIFKEAAHEIKSPIAILKARLALFKQDDHGDKEAFVKESEHDIKTISDKLRELLFLKEIEYEMQKQKESISMQSQCMMMQSTFKPILEKKSLKMVSNWDEDFRLFVHKEAMAKVMQAIFENIFMHTKNHSTITNHVDASRQRLHIINEIGDGSDEKLFSSHIGSKMIARLADKLEYTYKVEAKEGYFYTTITFHTPELS